MSFVLNVIPLQQKISRLDKAVVTAVRAENRAQVRTLRDLVRELAPVDTGELKASYKIEGYSVVSRSDHAYYQEYGTRYHPPQAHMRPAVDQRRRPYFDEMARAAARAMKNG